MRRTEAIRQKLRFCPENHYSQNSSYEEYAIDWRTGVKHIVQARVLNIGEGNAITLTDNLHRAPDDRKNLERVYGIDIRMRDELPADMYVPGDDRRIPKSNITSETTFIIDKDKVKALPAMWGSVAKWHTFDTEVETNTVIETLEPNKAVRAAWLKEHEEVLQMAAAATALAGKIEPGINWKASKRVLEGSREDMDLRLLHAFVTRNTAGWNRKVLELTGDRCKYPYLTLRPFQP